MRSQPAYQDPFGSASDSPLERILRNRAGTPAWLGATALCAALEVLGANASAQLTNVVVNPGESSYSCEDKHVAWGGFDPVVGENTGHVQLRYSETRFTDTDQRLVGEGNIYHEDRTELHVYFTVTTGGCTSLPWTVKVTARRAGLVQVIGDSDGYGTANLHGMGALFYGSGIALTGGQLNMPEQDYSYTTGVSYGLTTIPFDDEVVGYLSGVGEQPIEIEYYWNAETLSGYPTWDDGDEALVLLGRDPELGGCTNNYGGSYSVGEQAGDGFFLDFEVTYDCATPVMTVSDPSPCVGGSTTLSLLNVPPCTMALWYHNGFPMNPQPQGTTLVISNVQPSHAGAYNAVMSCGPCCCGPTNSVALTVDTPATVPQTLDLAVCSGSAASWSVTPGGTAPFIYQWAKNGVPISGATSSFYQIPVTTTASGGNYSVAVTNSCGTTVKSGMLTIRTVPEIPDSLTQSVCLGQDLLLSVNPTGGAPFIYQWAKNGVPISGAVGSSYLIANATASSGGAYSVAVTNSCGTTLKSGTVTVLSPPTFTGSLDQTVCAGSAALWTVTPSGSGPFTFQWKKNGNPIGGANTASYVIATSAETHEGPYSVSITNSCGSIEPSGFLTVNSSPTVTNPSDMTLCEGPSTQNVFTVTGTGQPSPTFEWYGPGPTYPFAGTGSTLQMVITPAKAGLYYAKATNGACADSPPSLAAQLTVNTRPTITQQPVPITVCATDDPQDLFSVAASGTPTLNYKWYGPGPSYPLVGSGPVLSKVVTSGDSGSYYAVVTNPCDSTGVFSNVVALVVKAKPIVTVAVSPDPLTAAVCGASDVTLTASVSQAPTPYVFRWFKDTAGNQVGGNSPTLHLGAVQAAATYWVEVTSADGCIGTSDVVPLASGQDGVHAQWTGPDGASMLLYGMWQRLLPLSQACGSWNGQPGALGVCPPPGFARFKNGGGSLNTAVLEDDDSWSVEQVEIEGASSAAEQRVAIRFGAELDVKVCTTVKANGVLSLEGGNVDAGLVTVKSGGEVEGNGQLATTGSIENFGEIRSAGPSLSELTLALSSLDPTLHNHPAAELRVPAASASMRVLGSLENGIPNVPSGLVDVETNGRLTVTDTVKNHGLVQVAHSGGGIQSNLSFKRFENHVGVATCPSCPTLTAGTWLKGGKLTATGSGSGDRFDNFQSAKLHGWGLIDSDVTNQPMAKIKASGTNAVLIINGCLTNNGVVQVDPGMTLVLNNGTQCDPGDGFIGFVQDNGTLVLGASAASTLIAQGDLLSGPGGQLQLFNGLVQVLGHFRSEIPQPYAFDLGGTRVEMNGYGFDGAQELVLAAPHLGAIGDFDSQRAMALGELVVGPTPALVVLAPHADGSPAVLYVKHLDVASGATLELGDTTVYADEVTLQPGATVSLSSGRLYYGTVDPANPCASGQVIGGNCTSQFRPTPAPDCNGSGTADSVEIAAGTAPDCNGNGVPDACDIELGRSLDQDRNTVPDDCQMLHADRPWLSASQGGKQTLSLHAGIQHAGKPYILSGSVKGTRPGSLNGGPFMPNPSTNGIFGVLDAEGRATTAIELEPGQLSLSMVGMKFHHSFVVVEAGRVVATSNPTALEIRE